MELHKLFESNYEKLEIAIDEIAERITKLGVNTPGALKEFLDATSLKETSGKYPIQKNMIAELLSDHETVIKMQRQSIDTCDEKLGDVATADFLTDLLKQHETMAWTLRRYLS